MARSAKPSPTPKPTPTPKPPGYPGYPCYPGYPNYPGYRGYRGYPGYPGYPDYPPYPGYPCPPTPDGPPPKPDPPPKPPKPKITGPHRTSAVIDGQGRFVLRRIALLCPAGSPCSASGRAQARRPWRRRVGRIRPVAFTIPAARASRVRFRLPDPSRKGRRRAAGALLDVTLMIRATGSGKSARRRIAVRLRLKHSRSRTRRAAPVARGRAPGAGSRPLLPTGPLRPLIGISDQEPGTFADALFGDLGMGIARLIVPWDAATTEPDRVDAWMHAARAAGVEPLVVLEHGRADRCPASPCRLPSIADYQAKVRALLDRYPWLDRVTAWNEPNHRSQPTAGNPGRAAGYYNAARAACPHCTLVAGDLLDASNLGSWLSEYRRHLSEEPSVWGLHNYFDTTYGRSTGVQTMLDAVPGDLWLTETGGIVRHDQSNGGGLPYDEQRARRGVAHALSLAAAHRDRLRRVYVYQWKAGSGATFDAGLLRHDGTARPAYRLLLEELGTTPQSSQTLPARPGVAPVATIAGRLALTGRRLRVPLACTAAAGCAATLTVESSAWRTGLLVNGRPQGHLFGPRTRHVALRGGARGTATITVPTRALRQPSLRVRVEVTAGGGHSVRLVQLRVRRQGP